MSHSAYPICLSLPVEGPCTVAVANLERAVLDNGGLFCGSERGGWFSLATPWGEIFAGYGTPSDQVEVRFL